MQLESGSRSASVDIVIPVKIVNPEPGGGDSNSIDFILSENHTFTSVQSIQFDSMAFSAPVLATGPEMGELHIVCENYYSNSDIYAISYLHSSDEGATWSNPINLVESEQKCSYPAIAIDSAGNIYVSFFADQLYFLHRKPGESLWQTPMVLASGSSTAIESTLHVDPNDRIHITWSETDNSGNLSLYYASSGADSNQWTQPINIAAGKANYSSAYNQSIASDGNSHVYAAWTSWPKWASRYGYTYTNYSHDGGLSWQSSDKTFNVSSSLAIAIDSEGSLCLLASQSYLPFQNKIVFYKSKNYGASYSLPINITEYSSDREPRIKIDSRSNYNVIFRRQNQLLFTRSTNLGQDWSPLHTVSSNFSSIQNGEMAVDREGNIYLIYLSTTGGNTLRFQKSRTE